MGWFLSTRLEWNPSLCHQNMNVWMSERFGLIRGSDRVTNDATCSGKLVVLLEFAAVYIYI